METKINPPMEDFPKLAQSMVLYLKDCDLPKDKYPGHKFPKIYMAMDEPLANTVMSNLMLIENPADWIPDHITSEHGQTDAVLVTWLDNLPPPDRGKWDERVRPYIKEVYGIDAILLPHIPNKDWPKTTKLVIWIPIASEFKKFKLILGHLSQALAPQTKPLLHPKFAKFNMTKLRREKAAEQLNLLQKNMEAAVVYGVAPTLTERSKITLCANGLIMLDAADAELEIYPDSPILESLKD